MDKYGPSLKHISNTFGGSLPARDVLRIGLQVLDTIQIMHQSGVVYNNLKMEHILIGDSQFSEDSREQIKLIDFSLAKKILDDQG